MDILRQLTNVEQIQILCFGAALFFLSRQMQIYFAVIVAVLHYKPVSIEWSNISLTISAFFFTLLYALNLL